MIGVGAMHYSRSDHITVAAPIAHAYAVATDPANVPLYAGEVEKIEVLSRDAHGTSAHVRSYLRVLGFIRPFEYRYRYNTPRFYGGVQEGRSFLRGYFSMRFQEQDAQHTHIEHVEGIISRVPYLARIAGWIWFRLLSPDGIDEELAKLKKLIETHPNSSS